MPDRPTGTRWPTRPRLRQCRRGLRDSNGRPLGIKPNLLVVPPALESKGLKLLNSENAAGGETNEWKGTAELLVVPWLA